MTEITCPECGWIVKGSSEKHAKANMKHHKRGKNHKIRLKLISKMDKAIENGEPLIIPRNSKKDKRR